MLQHPANRAHNPQLHTRPATWKSTAQNTTRSNHCIILFELLMMDIVMPETCWASNEICNKKPLLHLVGILFPHINDDARSKSHQTVILVWRHGKKPHGWCGWWLLRLFTIRILLYSPPTPCSHMSTNSKLFSTNEIYLLDICTNMRLNGTSRWRRGIERGVGCRGMLKGDR